LSFLDDESPARPAATKACRADTRLTLNSPAPAPAQQQTSARPGQPPQSARRLRRWIDRCRRPIDAKDDKYPHLSRDFFPGCDSDTGLCTTLTTADHNCRELPSRELERASGLPGELAVRAMVDVYMDELEALA
jgi:hypothetical protein